MSSKSRTTANSNSNATVPRPPRRVPTGLVISRRSPNEFSKSKRLVNRPEHTSLPLVHQVCGLVDPFCEHAIGAKYPDDSSRKTLAYSLRQQFNLNTDANGNTAIAILPQMANGTIVTGTVAIGTTNVTSSTAVAAAPSVGPLGATGYRIVSCGVRLKNIAPLLTASGLVLVRSWASVQGSHYLAYDGASYNASQVRNVALPDCKDEIVVFERTSQMPQTFYPFTIGTPAVIDWQPSGFQPITITISGGPPSTASVFVELVYNVEFFFDDTDPLGMVATRAQPSNPIVTSVANTLTSAAQTWAHSGLERFSKYVKGAAVGYVARAMLASPNPVLRLGAAAFIPNAD